MLMNCLGLEGYGPVHLSRQWRDMDQYTCHDNVEVQTEHSFFIFSRKCNDI